MKQDKKLQKQVEGLIEDSFKDGKIIESRVAKSIKILKTLSGPKAIWALTQYLKSLKRLERAHTMYLETTIPLSLTQIQKMKKLLKKKTQITKVVTNINPEILGGFNLRVGDGVWDETILTKIHQVKEVISGRYHPAN